MKLNFALILRAVEVTGSFGEVLAMQQGGRLPIHSLVLGAGLSGTVRAASNL
jgi:hypothetical protein